MENATLPNRTRWNMMSYSCHTAFRFRCPHRVCLFPSRFASSRRFSVSKAELRGLARRYAGLKRRQVIVQDCSTCSKLKDHLGCSVAFSHNSTAVPNIALIADRRTACVGLWSFSHNSSAISNLGYICYMSHGQVIVQDCSSYSKLKDRLGCSVAFSHNSTAVSNLLCKQSFLASLVRQLFFRIADRRTACVGLWSFSHNSTNLGLITNEL
ncbi:hypothetical protein ACQ4PT_044878 [Festuca glaucescens]